MRIWERACITGDDEDTSFSVQLDYRRRGKGEEGQVKGFRRVCLCQEKRNCKCRSKAACL